MLGNWDRHLTMRTFLWTVKHKVLLTNDMRRNGHRTQYAHFDFCGGVEETWIHVLRDCEEVHLLWSNLVSESELLRFFQANPDDWFQVN